MHSRTQEGPPFYRKPNGSRDFRRRLSAPMHRIGKECIVLLKSTPPITVPRPEPEPDPEPTPGSDPDLVPPIAPQPEPEPGPESPVPEPEPMPI